VSTGPAERATADLRLYQSIVESASDVVTVFRPDGTITFMNSATQRELGHRPDAMIGRNILEFVHPDDHQRATETLRVAATFGTSSGTTHFRLQSNDGSYHAFEMTSGTVHAPDGGTMLMTLARAANTRFTLDMALRQLLEDRPVPEVISAVCDLFDWRGVDTRVAVSWLTADGAWQWVGTPGCAAELGGSEMAAGSLWAAAVATGVDVIAETTADMPAAMRVIAERHNRAGYWIGPIVDGERRAVISAWTAPNRFPPTYHNDGMALAKRFIRLMLRWADQQHRLDRAAHVDDLTGLTNRRSFFETLSASKPGAILYCDLDRFKPVNDQHGHAAGDEVLRQVARRLRDAVRAGDTVARIGGDEFAIICPASTAADAAILAARIRAAVEPPIDVGTASVSIGISIGVAHTTDRMDAASVAAADRDLYAAKAERRARYLREV
jgi:diguanylate cyclase (GGDEF)-like protein/PAS domain S-box-containing protein